MSTATHPAVGKLSFHAPLWSAPLIAIADVIALQASLTLGLGLRLLLWRWFDADIEPEQYLALALGLVALPAVYYQLGLYPGYLVGPVERLRRRTLGTFAVFGGLVAWDNIVERGVLSRGVLLATFVFALILAPLAETATRTVLERRKRWGIPVVMLGAGETGREIAETLHANPHLGLVPIAFLDNHPNRWNTFIDGVPVIGPLGLAQDLERTAEAAIIVSNDIRREELPELNFPRVILIPSLTGVASLWITARDLGGCLGLELKKNLLIRRNTALKQIMDRVIALPLFLASLPVIALAGTWIKLSSPGPVFYRQLREGRGGRRVSVWKLRTMHLDSDRMLEKWFEEHPEDRVEWLRYFKLRCDPRVLPLIGRFLRRTSLDELPQLWSILKGEMSLVGPRPLPDYHLEQFSPEFRALRTRVLPGLTGLWQVSARSDGDVKVQESLDSYYIRNWSPWLDVYILARTLPAVLAARGAY